jgi:hypothetical protein
MTLPPGARHNAAIADFPEVEVAARMSFDAGVGRAPGDHALKAALAPYNTDEMDAQLWQLLPFAFASTLGTEQWRTTAYRARPG